MDKTEARIQELLDRNIFLDQRTKDRILASSPEVQLSLLGQLEGMDRESTDLFRKKLTKNPDLFEDMAKVMER
mgnify:CR=1 FL=1